ncbi:MAG: CinA family protein [Candidatus Zapsychrus exili]|nr:CinA family protein [Candidatus Zapsychrus exili]
MKIEEKVAKLLIQAKKTISIAESCTGGLLSSRLTDIPGSSQFLKLGLVVYSNEAKIKLLKIPKETIAKYGTVDENIAIKMAEQVRKLFKTDFGIGITGIAGPTGATKTKPIGLVYIAISTKFDCICFKILGTVPCGLSPNAKRKNIKNQTVNFTLKTLLEFL